MQTASGCFEIDSIVNYLFDQVEPDLNSTENKAEISSNVSKTEPVSDLPVKRIIRPIKIAASSNIRPLENDYLIITPMLGFHCMKPLYGDFGCRIESRFAKVLAAYYAFNFEDRVWKHTLGFSVDARVFKLLIAASSASPSFKGSFRGTGFEANIGILFGY